jgi:hypothetical protein
VLRDNPAVCNGQEGQPGGSDLRPAVRTHLLATLLRVARLPAGLERVLSSISFFDQALVCAV